MGVEIGTNMWGAVGCYYVGVFGVGPQILIRRIIRENLTCLTRPPRRDRERRNKGLVKLGTQDSGKVLVSNLRHNDVVRDKSLIVVNYLP